MDVVVITVGAGVELVLEVLDEIRLSMALVVMV